jgi:hypothetical protein
MASATYPGAGDNTPEARAKRERFWRDMIRRWKASGLSKTEFCKGESLSASSMHFWIGEIRRRDGGRTRPRLLATKPVAPAKTSFVPVSVIAAAKKSAEPIELVVGGHTLKVRSGFDPEALRQVVRALEVRP